VARLPAGYEISPERVPVPGTNITEGIGIDELREHLAEVERQRIEVQPMVRLSNLQEIPADELQEYLDNFNADSGRRFDKIDAMVVGSVATMSAVALAIAYRRLKNR
jgi:hypothetical protein